MNFLATMHWAFDISIIEFFNKWAQNSDFIATVFKLLSYLGTEYVIIVVFGLLYWGIDKKTAKEMGEAAFLVNLTNNTLKSFVSRMRPYQQSPETIKIKDESILLKDPNGNYIPVNGEYGVYYASSSTSFPSGHSAGASGLFNSYARSKMKMWAWIVATILCVLVMLSRMVLGAHFLTDVLTGYMVGLVVVEAIYFMREKAKNPMLINIIIMGVTGIITFLSPIWTDQARDLFTSWGIYVAIIIGMWLEEKYVNFELSKTWWKIVLRVLFGVLIAVGLKIILKLPYQSFVQEGSYLGNVLDMLRYSVLSFVAAFLYPMLIKKLKFLNDNNESN